MCEEALLFKLTEVTRQKEVLDARLTGCEEKLKHHFPERASASNFSMTVGFLLLLGIVGTGIIAVSL